MTLDWLTVAAQVLNFLVLVYLLKRFLFARVVRAMDQREEVIAQRMRAADARMEEAEQEARRHREARAALDAQRERVMSRAREDADDLRRRLEEEVREEIEQRRRRWSQQVEREQAAFLREVRRRTAEQFERLARRALSDLADAELEAQMVRVLVERLQRLGEEQREVLRVASAAAGEPLVVRSAFDLSVAVKRSLTAALHEAFGKETAVRYEAGPDLACGIELRAGGQSLAWTLDGYLEAMDRRLEDALAEGAHREPGEARG